MTANDCNIDQNIGFIGAGKMASAIMGAMTKSGFKKPCNIYVYDVSSDAINSAKQDLGVNSVASIEELLNKVQVVVVATKPFVINEVLESMENNLDDQLVISILAGVKTAVYEEKLPNVRVIRVMPNTPAFVFEGMCAICCGQYALQDDVQFVENMLSSVGKTVRIDEKDMDVVTALSGSGPAFYYYIVDLMAQAAVKLGLDYDTAVLLSAQTALGSAKMMLEHNQTPQELIKAVTTPGGCTEVGNDVLKKSGLSFILDATIKNTMQKAKSLG